MEKSLSEMEVQSCSQPLETQLALSSHGDCLAIRSINNQPFFQRRQIEVRRENGRLVLHGVVSSFYEKQMAQEIIRRLPFYESIQNQISVASDGQR